MPERETLERPPWGTLVRFVLYAAGLGLLGEVALYRLPVDDAWELFGEYGRLETIQVWLLVIAFAIAATTAMRKPATRPLTVLLAGLVFALLVREHGTYLQDHGFPGLVAILLGVVVIATLAVAWRTRRNLVPALQALCSCPCFGWMAAAVLVVVFAQFLDERSLWELVTGEKDCPMAVRHVGEESLEVVAYYLFAVGLLEYRGHARHPGSPGR